MSDARIATQSSAMMFDRTKYFDSVRASMFPGGFTQQQVDGQEIILSKYEQGVRASDDLRHLSYMLGTTRHETASTMWPIEEYEGDQQSYGKIDPETGQGYWGRGFVQLTHRDNYERADQEMGWTGEQSCEYHADHQLKPEYAAPTMFRGMWEGWFRSGNDLFKFFNDTVDDPYNAREIINGDRNYHVSWDDRTIGQIIADYHDDFLAALEEALIDAPPAPQPKPPRPPRPLVPILPRIVTVDIMQPFGVQVEVNIIEKQPNWDALRAAHEQMLLRLQNKNK